VRAELGTIGGESAFCDWSPLCRIGIEQDFWHLAA
jgi:hypothetical protein